jgi:stage II sporulation protein D
LVVTRARRHVPLFAAIAAAAAAWPGVAAAKPALYISGAGFGHGIGMSQWGADGFARHGYDYATILGHYYAATTLGTVPTSQHVRVLMTTRATAAFRGASRAGGHALSPSRRYSAVPSGGSISVVSSTGRSVGTFAAPLRVSGPGPLTLYGTAGNGVRDGRYRGALELRPVGGQVQVVNVVALESYVRGVVAAEVPASWPMAALETQAVATRSYAIAATVSGQPYTQYSDTRSQSYRGVGAEDPRSDAAVKTTSGQVVEYLGAPVATYFFSSSGGETEDVQNVFLGTQPDPWLTAVADPYDALSPDHRWGPITLSLASVQARLGGLIKGAFKGIHVTRRGASPRIVSAQVLGSGGATTVSGPQLESRLGLKDTWAYFSTTHAPVVPPTPGAPSGPIAPVQTVPAAPTGPGGGVSPPGSTTTTTTTTPTSGGGTGAP